MYLLFVYPAFEIYSLESIEPIVSEELEIKKDIGMFPFCDQLSLLVKRERPTLASATGLSEDALNVWRYN
jgi:hypothetical protein